MTETISASVGAAGRNIRADVAVVQRQLNARGLSAGTVDGLCGPRTLHAILGFQAGFLPRPDGRIDVNGLTWRQLAGGAVTPARPGARPPPPPTVPSSGDSAMPSALLTATKTRLLAVRR